MTGGHPSPPTCVAYCCPYVPPEWIAAHGLSPHRVLPASVPAGGDRGIREGLCTYVQAFLDHLRRAEDIRAAILTTLCDQMRRAGELLAAETSLPVFLLNVPSTWQTAASRELYAEELRRLGRFLVRLGGRAPGDGELTRQMRRYDAARSALRRLVGQVAASAWSRAAAKFPCQGRLDDPPSPQTSGAPNGVALAILGGPLLAEDMALLDIIEQAGGRVVLDATDSGERALPAPFDLTAASRDALGELARAYFDHIPHAANRPDSRLVDWLGAELSSREVRGIVFHRHTWCDLWHGELARLRGWTDLPVLDLNAGAGTAPRDRADPGLRGDPAVSDPPAKITLQQWDGRYQALRGAGLREPFYGGPLRRHADGGDLRLTHLHLDNSPAALRLWNFLLTEEQRLHRARRAGRKLLAAMKDLGTVPVMAYSAGNVTAFYPDGAWWAPCVTQLSNRLLAVADGLGFDESFCPVRAMLGAFVTGSEFPEPDMLVCSVGATCDDFSAIAQHLQTLGRSILWWEMPHRRAPEEGDQAVELPGGFRAPESQVAFVAGQLQTVREAIARLSGQALDDAALAAGIGRANQVRQLLTELRRLTFTAPRCPLPALEMLIAEMLAIHFCSDQDECITVLTDLLDEVRHRVGASLGLLDERGARVLGESPRRSPRDEPAGGLRRAIVRERLYVPPRPGCDPHRSAAPGGPGADGAGRSDGRTGGGPGRENLSRCADRRRAGDNRLPHPRGQPLRHRGPSHRPGCPSRARHAGGGDRSASRQRSAPADDPHADRGAPGGRPSPA